MENTCVCCGRVIPEGSQVCPICVALAFNTPNNTYIQFDCPECGAPLQVWSEEVLESKPGSFDSFGYERRALIRHCDRCHRDWENEWETQFGDVGESQLRRKFWG